ncbi:MAG: phytanoyl-CoA dioxygenase family protein [Chitinophagales bacterium]
MNSVFVDDVWNKQFIQNGFIILKNAISIDFDKNYSFFNSLESNVDNKFYTSLWSSNQEYRILVDTKIKEILTPVCDKYLNNYHPFFSDLLVKKPSLTHRLNWHQDWTFTDEEKYTQVFLWMPLQKVTKQNGCIMLLPKSHQYFQAIRGTNIPSGLNYSKLNEFEKKYAQYIELERGDILVLNQSLLHASLPNRSFNNRLALGLYCLPENAPVYHYHYDILTNKILKYEIDQEFIFKLSSNQDFKYSIMEQKMPRPIGKIIEEVELADSKYDVDFYLKYEEQLKHK